MSKTGEYVCLGMNRLFPEYPKYAKSGERYADAELRDISQDFDSFYSKYNLNFEDKVVLDAGCGHGGKTVYYSRLGCRNVYGVDFDEKHVELSRTFAAEQDARNVEFDVQSLEDLKFDSDTFDVIFLNGVLEHIRREIMVPALAELKRVLKPGGRLLIEFPPWSSPYAAHLIDVINIPWCQYMFSDNTLVNATNRLGPPTREGQLSYTEHFMELNRLTISEFQKIIADLEYQVVDIDLIVAKRINALKRIPFISKFFISSVHAVLSK